MSVGRRLPVALHIGAPDLEGDATGETSDIERHLPVALHLGVPNQAGDATGEVGR